MILVRTMLTGMLALGATAASAADHCVSRAEQRAQAASHAVVPLAQAMLSVRGRGEVVHARLCDVGGQMIYLLTVVERDGKVAQANVDAVNGALVSLNHREKK